MIYYKKNHHSLKYYPEYIFGPRGVNETFNTIFDLNIVITDLKTFSIIQ